MNENKRVDNRRIKIAKCDGAEAQHEKCVGTQQKQTVDIIFNIQNSQLLTWSLPTEEIFQIHGQNRPVANLPVVDFRSQPREIPLPKQLNEYLSVFFLYFGFLAFCLGKFESDTDFSGFESQCSKKISRNYPGLRMVKASPFIHQPDRVERKANDVSAAVWRYQKHVKKIWYFFHMCCYGFSQS